MAVIDHGALFHHISGSYAGDVFTYDLTSKTGLIRRRPLPKKRTRATPAQKAWRTVYRECVMLWVAKSSAQKQLWKDAINHAGISGYDVFMSTALRSKRDGLDVPATPPPGAGCKPICPRPKKPKKPDPPRVPPSPPPECDPETYHDWVPVTDYMNADWNQWTVQGDPIKTDNGAYVYTGLSQLQISTAMCKNLFCESDFAINAWYGDPRPVTPWENVMFARCATPDAPPGDCYEYTIDMAGATRLYVTVGLHRTLLDTGWYLADGKMKLRLHGTLFQGIIGTDKMVEAWDNTLATGYYVGFQLIAYGFFKRNYFSDWLAYNGGLPWP